MRPESAQSKLADLADVALDRRPLAPDPRPGLYVHVPFCERICPYCDFSVVGARHPGRVDFVETLLREAEAWSVGAESADSFDGSAGSPADAGDFRAASLGRVFGAEFGTVYFGGGTPSVLNASELGRLVAGLHERLPIAADARWTIEANPEHVDSGFAGQVADLGIEHVSLGVQSLEAGVLVELGRAHGPQDVERSVERLRDAGVEWISIDLIYAVNSDLERWTEQLRRAAELGPEHLSCYELTIHEGTRFGREVSTGRRAVVDEDSRYRFFVSTLRHLADAGYRAYEVSNFARDPSSRSPHNQKYWAGVPYLGLGPSAHSYDGQRRWWNHRLMKDWRRAVSDERRAIEAGEVLGPRELLFERLMTGTRTAAGLDLAAMRRDFGFDPARDSSGTVERLVSTGRVECLDGADRLVPTVNGLATADQLAVELFPGDAG